LFPLSVGRFRLTLDYENAQKTSASNSLLRIFINSNINANSATQILEIGNLRSYETPDNLKNGVKDSVGWHTNPGTEDDIVENVTDVGGVVSGTLILTFTPSDLRPLLPGSPPSFGSSVTSNSYVDGEGNTVLGMESLKSAYIMFYNQEQTDGSNYLEITGITLERIADED
jgi:hypothetical protein